MRVSNASQTRQSGRDEADGRLDRAGVHVSSNAGPFDLASVSTPVLLEVFATWCPHCQREVPVVNCARRRRTPARSRSSAFPAARTASTAVRPKTKPTSTAVGAEARRDVSGRVRSRPEGREPVSAGRLSDDRDDRQSTRSCATSTAANSHRRSCKRRSTAFSHPILRTNAPLRNVVCTVPASPHHR